jgi:hypothetical protein
VRSVHEGRLLGLAGYHGVARPRAPQLSAAYAGLRLLQLKVRLASVRFNAIVFFKLFSKLKLSLKNTFYTEVGN